MVKSFSSRSMTNLPLSSVTVTGTMTSFTCTLIGGGSCAWGCAAGGCDCAQIDKPTTMDNSTRKRIDGRPCFDYKGTAAALPYHPSRPAALHKLLHFLAAHPAEIPRNRVLQTRRRHRELQRLTIPRQIQQPENQPRRKAVPAAHAIHNMRDLIMPAQQKFLPVMQTSRPPVMRRALRLPQRNRQHLQIRIRRQHLLRQRAIRIRIQLSRM